MRSRSLLVTFDAWKTLVTTRESPATQYTRLAREHGVDAKEHQVAEGFTKGNHLNVVSQFACDT